MMAEQKKTKEKSPAEVIADNLAGLADSIEKLLKGPLNRKALILLLAASSGLTKQQTADMLSALENLRKDWLL